MKATFAHSLVVVHLWVGDLCMHDVLQMLVYTFFLLTTINGCGMICLSLSMLWGCQLPLLLHYKCLLGHQKYL